MTLHHCADSWHAYFSIARLDDIAALTVSTGCMA